MGLFLLYHFFCLQWFYFFLKPSAGKADGQPEFSPSGCLPQALLMRLLIAFALAEVYAWKWLKSTHGLIWCCFHDCLLHRLWTIRILIQSDAKADTLTWCQLSISNLKHLWQIPLVRVDSLRNPPGYFENPTFLDSVSIAKSIYPES